MFVLPAFGCWLAVADERHRQFVVSRLKQLG
jgi:hypothetical protein